MAWTERYVDSAAAGGGDGTTSATSGANGAWTLAEAIAASNAGHRLNVKAGTYANTTTDRTFGIGAGAATTTSPKWWRGYTSTIGDLDTNPSTTRTAGTDFPLFTFTTGDVLISGVHQTFSNIEIRGTAPGQRLVSVTGSKCKFIRCRFDCQEAAATSYTVRASSDGIAFVNCWFKGTSTVNQVAHFEERITADGCVFRGGGNGLLIDGAVEHNIRDCIFDDNGDDAIEMAGNGSRNVVIDGCTFYSPGGHGINNTTTVPGALVVRNCLFHTITTASKYGLRMVGDTNVPVLAGNTWYNVTTRTNNLLQTLIGAGGLEFFGIAEGSDPLTNAASHDLSVVSGASTKGAALPALFENESYKSFRDGGAVQREEAGGGSGGGPLIGPGRLIRN